MQDSMQDHQASSHFVGTIRHQFSPRIVTLVSLSNTSFWKLTFLLQTSVNLFQPYTTKFEFNYNGPENCWNVVTGFNPATNLAIPPTIISYSRRLFRSSPQRGEIIVKVAKQPSLSFLYQSPPTLELKEWEGASPQLGPPTTLGLKYVLFERSYGLVFEGVLPYLIGRVTMSLVELSVDFKASIQYGFTGLLVSLGAKWSNKNAEVASTLALNPSAVVLELEWIPFVFSSVDALLTELRSFSYLEQQLSLPIVLSTHFSPFLALGAVVVPSAVTILGYHFIIIPRRRSRRLAWVLLYPF